jgi:hypothetical protein
VESPVTADNTISGHVVGTVVQAGAISGGFHHHTPSPGVRLPHRFGAVPARAGCYQHRAVRTTLTQSGESDTTTSVLSGLGGVGKTQLAADLAEHLWSTGALDLLIWTTAGSRHAIVSDYARVVADLTGTQDSDFEDGARRLLDWLANARCRWLVVLDDLQSPAHLAGLWPPRTVTGRIVVTTRRRDAALLGYGRQVIDVCLFTPVESHRYLTAKLGDAANGVDEAAGELGHLPLALSQAAAYMLDRGLTCADYQRRLTDQRRTLASLVPDNEGLPDQYQVTIAATWSLSIERADQLSPQGLARPLMELGSLLDPNGLPAALLSTHSILHYLGNRVGHPVTAEQAHDAVRNLHRLNLVTLDPQAGHRAVRVHALLQRATRDRLSACAVLSIAIALSSSLMHVWSDGVHDRVLTQVLRANAEALRTATIGRLEPAAEDRTPNVKMAPLNRHDWGKAAVAYLHRLRAAATIQLGPDHPDTLAAWHCLATWQGKTGDPATAAAMFNELLTTRTRVLGQTHPDVIRTRHSLADCRGEATNPEDALTGLTELLADCVHVMGDDHPDTLDVRYSLARWRGRSGDGSSAAAAFDELYADHVRVLGPDHLDTIGIRYSVARWRQQAGDHGGAVATFHELYADHVRVLGPDHPDTLAAGHSLIVWQDQDHALLEEISAFERRLSDRLRSYGPSHAGALDMRIFLAAYRAKQASLTHG